jgi:signal transduction histidine kinase/ActR/RegA family two-component response regulator
MHPTEAETAQRGGVTLTTQELQAQGALLPYALVLFAVTMPIFVWAGSYARNAVWMSALFAQFAVNWAAFYFAVRWLKQQGDREIRVRERLLIQLAGGLLWAVTAAEISLFGMHAGEVSDIILMMGAAVAAACFFFSAPCVLSLLIVGPAAAAAPLIGLWFTGRDPSIFQLTAGALAMAKALSLIHNRILRRQFTLAAEREVLIVSRADSLTKAEFLAKSKSDILATLSHEIRNGLTGVAHVLATAAGAGGRTAPSREQLGAALDAAHQLLEVLNATLDTETAGQGRLSVAARPFDPCRMARDMALLCRSNASAKNLELSIHVGDELEDCERGAAVADLTRARQVLSNLIGNAVKYTQRGRIEVRVLRPDARTVRFEVADTGPGLSTEELEKAFQPFSRIERTGLGLPGAGLGLSLSRELARLMGGDVSAESAVGVGSRFWFDLPYDPMAEVPAEPTAENAEPGPAQPQAQNLRILVAEDDQLNAAMLRAVLEQLGHQVVHARDGRRAVELAGVCAFDVIMLDGRMPHMTGAEAAEAIRGLDGGSSNAPIVAVIGGGPEEAEQCTHAGADEVLRKPVSVAGVARAVSAAIARAERRGADNGPRLHLVG